MNLLTRFLIGSRVFLACGLTLAGIGLYGSQASAQVIYADNFTGSSSSPLNGTVPTIDNYSGTPGPHPWSASSHFFADGSLTTTSANASAALPFVPENGKIYTLTATLNSTVAGNPWLAVGFESVGTTTGTFTANGGAAWMLLRGNRGAGGIQVFGGPNTTQIADVTTNQNAPTGPVDFKIVLDTAEPNWRVTWFADGTQLATGTYATNPTINFVALNRNTTASGTFDNFSLSVVPEPGAVAAVCFGGMSLLARRQRWAR